MEPLKESDYDKTPFFMVVPTFSFQNYKEKSTYLEFHHMQNPKECLGKLNASCGSLSMQLIGLQANCKHSVKNRNEMNNTGLIHETGSNNDEFLYKAFYNTLPTKHWVISVRACTPYWQKHGYNEILRLRNNEPPPIHTRYNYLHDWNATGKTGEMLSPLYNANDSDKNALMGENENANDTLNHLLINHDNILRAGNIDADIGKDDQEECNIAEYEDMNSFIKSNHQMYKWKPWNWVPLNEPKLNERAIGCSLSISEILSSGYVCRKLIKRRIIPMLHYKKRW